MSERLFQLRFEWNRQIIDFEDFLQVFPEHLDFRFLIDGELHEDDDVRRERFDDLSGEEKVC
jgi:CRISPR/Cas system CSM-associated protein Csm2 small subunit